jgi:hypothetical protein
MSGIYSLKCATYNIAYVGKTGRSLKLRNSEHTTYIKYNLPISTY